MFQILRLIFIVLISQILFPLNLVSAEKIKPESESHQPIKTIPTSPESGESQGTGAAILPIEGTVGMNGNDASTFLREVTVTLITSGGKIQGDANEDNSVDASDYVVWRKNKDKTGANAADFNLDNVVDQIDYDIWRAKFGVRNAIIEMAISENGIDFGPWLPYQNTFTHTLSEGLGVKTIHIKVRDFFLSEAVITDTITLSNSGTITVPGGDQYTILNGVVTEVTKPNGTKLTYSGGTLSQVKESDGDTFTYTNGVLNKIQRTNGDNITPITLGANDVIQTGQLVLSSRTGRIARANGELFQNGGRFFSNGSIEEPNAPIFTSLPGDPFFGSSGNEFQNRPPGEFVYKAGVGATVWGGWRHASAQSNLLAGARYVKFNLNTIPGITAPTQVRIEFFEQTGSQTTLVPAAPAQTYNYSGSSTYYFEIPTFNPPKNIRQVRLTFPCPTNPACGLSIVNVETVSFQNTNQSEWTNMASAYASSKTAPTIPTQVTDAIPAGKTLGTEGATLPNEFEITPEEINQGIELLEEAQAGLDQILEEEF